MTWFVFAIAAAAGATLIRGLADGNVSAFKRTFSRAGTPRSYWAVMTFIGVVAVAFVSLFVWQALTF